MAMEDKESEEQYHPLRDGKNTVKEWIMGEEQGALVEDELKSDGIAKDEQDVLQGLVQVHAASQMPQKQPQGAIICWERFLHLRSIKVLLVEHDDSTRHVVTALLRNCSYEVIGAADALQAWRILEDLTNHIDLVLTEVVMHPLSGMGLLCKIMNHRTRNNLPVIMMSSHDSMNLVFKCLSKGAVDFLVKPIRKNELKNLWQHVWRRCHSSSGSGSGSGSGTQTQKSVKSRSVEKCENNTCSNDEDDNGSFGLSVGAGSDSGSGTQSSWTKQALEVDNPRPESSQDQIVECHESTRAQVFHSSVETSGNNLDPVAKTRKWHENKEELGMPEGLVTVTARSQMDSTEFEAPNSNSKISDINNKSTDDIETRQSVELSLKRLQGVKDAGTTVPNDQSVLRHSALSAFSRYKVASNANKVPTGNVGSSYPHDSILYVTMKESLHDIQSHSSCNPPNPWSNGGSSKIDMGSMTNNAFVRSVIINKSAAKSSVNHLHPSSAFHAVKEDPICALHQVVLDNGNDVAATGMPAQPRGTHKELQNEHLHHDYNYHHNLVQDMQQQLPPDHTDLSLKKMAAATPHYGSSNVLGGPLTGNAADNSVNGSASRNGQNGSTLMVNTGGKNIESDNSIAGKSSSGDASGIRIGNREDHHKFAQREDALTRFRQKRNERNFRKKVQYQSRKRLAEERPRIRGQFVRKKVSENTSGPTNS